MGGKINRPGQLAPGGEDNQGGGKITRDSLPPGGQAVQGGQDKLLHRAINHAKIMIIWTTTWQNQHNECAHSDAQADLSHEETLGP